MLRPSLSLGSFSVPREDDDATRCIKINPSKPLLHVPQRPIDLNKIEISIDSQQVPSYIYLGAGEDITRHKAQYHPHSSVTVINANAVNNPMPFTDSQIICSQTIKASFHQIIFKQADRSQAKSPAINIDHKHITTTDNIEHSLINIYMADTESAPIHLIFDSISDALLVAINKSQQDKIPLYINCQAGISRSASLLLAFFAKYGNYTDFESAYNDLHSYRSKVAPNIGFTLQLKKYLEECASNRPADPVRRPIMIYRQTPVQLDTATPASAISPASSISPA